MHTLLFLDTENTGLDPGKDRIVQLGTRLVLHNSSQDYLQLVCPDGFSIPPAATKIHCITDQVATAQGISIEQVLNLLTVQLRQAEIIIGHNVAYDIAILLAEARRPGHKDVIELLPHPHFGYDVGARATICTQQLAINYLQYLGEPASLSDTKLTTIYRRLFGEERSNTHDALADAIACQRVYDYLSNFQRVHQIEFLASIVCLDD